MPRQTEEAFGADWVRFALSVNEVIAPTLATSISSFPKRRSTLCINLNAARCVRVEYDFSALGQCVDTGAARVMVAFKVSLNGRG